MASCGESERNPITSRREMWDNSRVLRGVAQVLRSWKLMGELELREGSCGSVCSRVLHKLEVRWVNV